MEPTNSNKFILYINGEFKGYVYSKDGTISIPVEAIDELGITAQIYKTWADINEGNEDDIKDGE